MKKIYLLFTLFVTSLQFAQTPTGTSQEVGITKGALSVSLGGGATYDVPLSLPPGIGGVVPEIGLSYNSQSGNGYVGYGWSFSGLSSIKRVMGNMYLDGEINPIEYDGSDRYALDGQRLIAGTPYNTAGTYVTESQSKLKITGVGTSPFGTLYGPSYFTVEYPNGSVAYYGNSTDSNCKNEWAITSWQNPQGIKISYEYNKAGDQSVNIKKIKYGGLSTNINIVNQVEFIYTASYRAERAYIAGSELKIDKNVQEIRVTANGAGYRNYFFDYDYSALKYSRMISITEKNGDNSKSFNPTVFTYETTPETASYIPQTTDLTGFDTRLDNSVSIPADFDGDGRMDILSYGTTGAINKNKYWLIVNDGGTAPTAYPHDPGTFEEIFVTTFLTGDVPSGYKLSKNPGWTIVQNVSTNVKFTVRGAGGFGGSHLEYDFSIPKTSIGSPNKYISGDFNGDALTDILAINTSTKSVYLINLDKRIGVHYTNIGLLNQTIGSGDLLRTGDFNGDGKTDLYHFKSGAYYIYKLTNTNLIALAAPTGSDSDINLSYPICLGDYNGDGKTDFIIPDEPNSTSWNVYMSTGSGINKNSTLFENLGYTASTTSETRHYIPVDFNHDGKTDLVTVAATTSNSSTPTGTINIKYYKNQGDIDSFHDFFQNIAGGYANANTGLQTGLDRFAVPIFLSSEKYASQGELSIMRGNKIYYFKSQKDFSKDILLKTITTGNGEKETITYSPLISCNMGCYEYTAEFEQVLNYPFYDIPNSDGFVVTKLERQSTGIYLQQGYRYFGAVTHLGGLGFMGFKGLERTNWYHDASDLIATVEHYDMTKRGALSDTFTVKNWAYIPGPAPVNFISKSIFTNSYYSASNNVYHINVTHAEDYNGLNNTSKITDYTYQTGPYGSYTILGAEDYVIKNGTTVEKTGNKTYQYDYNTAGSLYNYYLGRPRQVNVTETVDGVSATSEKKYTYTGMNLTLLQTKSNSSGYVNEAYTYDAFGNIKTKTVSSADVSNRVIDYTYDTSGRFLTKLIDAQGRVTEYTYDNNTGMPLTYKNASGTTTTYVYDTWSKKTKETDYLGKEINTTYTVLPGGMAEVNSVCDNGQATYEKFDDLGRSIAGGSKNIDDSWSYILKQYDDYNRVISTSEPVNSLSAVPAHFETAAYDLYGRPSQTTSMVGVTTTLTHSGLSTQITDSVKTKTIVRNSIGNIVSSTDPGGTINYTYFPNNEIKSSNYDVYVVTHTQDMWGRQASIADPTAGNYGYTYNSIGEILTLDTPKGWTNYSYYPNGTLSNKYKYTEDGDNSYTSTSTYTYDPTTKALKHLDWIDSNDETYSLDYTFDTYKRLQKVEEINAFTAKSTTTYEYDGFGRPYKKTIVANDSNPIATSAINRRFRTEYKNGVEWKIYDDMSNQLLWETGTVNARGQLLTANYGNGISITNTYDGFGFPTEFKYYKTGTTTNILKENTTFDAIRGNLTSRTNSMFSWNESFVYDNLDRLTEYTNARGEQEQQQYDDRGKITQSYLGTYNYNTTAGYKNMAIDMNDASESYYRNRLGIFNRSMENKSGWMTGKYASYSSVSAHTGSYSLKLGDPAGAQSCAADTYVPVNNTTTTVYKVSAWVLNNSAGNTTVTLLMKNTPGGTPATQPQTVMPAASWQNIEFTVSVAATVKFLSVRVSKGALTSVAYFDDVRIVKAADATATRQLNVTYNSDNDPLEVTETGVDRLTFKYNGLGGRTALLYGSLDSNPLSRPVRKYYFAGGDIEIKKDMVNNTAEYTVFVGGSPYSAPVIYKQSGNDPGNYYFLHRDYQGTILAISNTIGDVVEKRLFDAWGNIIKVQDGTGAALNGLTITDRGYTGHEHLQSVALIHMNGRLYDPVVHRFLQPDNYIVNAYDTQSYNRYGYVLNNPLRYTDTSGEYPDGNGGGSGEGQGLSFGTASVAGGVIYTLVENWDRWKIKDFFNHNVSNSFKDAGTWVGDRVTDVKNYFQKQYNSVFKRNSDGGPKAVRAISYSASPNMAWQNTSFDNITSTVKNVSDYLQSHSFDDMWNSKFARAYVADKITINFSASLFSYVGKSDEISFNFITRGHDASFKPYMLYSAGVEGGVGTSADALIGYQQGYYNIGDMRDLAPGDAVRGMLGWSIYSSLGLGDGVGGKLTGSIGFSEELFTSEITWYNIGVAGGFFVGGSQSVGASYTYFLWGPNQY